jgi:hypothetical protein
VLPKIHKENNPGRPIVSANGHPTEKISGFIDFDLRPYVENLPSHIKDTPDYLKKIENLTIPENTTIRFTLMAWLNGILLKQCLGWQLLGERY